MKKFLKITGISLLIILAILIIAPFLFKGKITQLIKDEANKNLNAELNFSELSISLLRDFPNLNLQIFDLSLKGKNTFEHDTLLKFNTFETSLNLKSVVFGDQIEVNKIYLEKAKVQAIVAKNGLANWDIMLPDTASQSVDNEEKKQEEDTASSSFALKLKELKIVETNIIYNDKQADLFAELNGFELELSGDMTEDVTNLKLQSKIGQTTVAEQKIKYLNKANINFFGDINADFPKALYSFDNTLIINALKLSFDGSVAMPDSNINLDVNFNAPDTKFKSLLSLIPAIYQKDFEDIKTHGTFNLTAYAKGTYNDKTMPAYGAELNVKQAGFAYPDLPKSVENININLSLDAKAGTGDDITIDIEKAHAEIAGNPLDASVFTHVTAKDTETKGNVIGKLDFSSVQDVLPLENVNLAGLLETKINFNVKLSDIEREAYEKVKANGYLKLNNFSYISPDYPKFMINTADIDLSPKYLSINRFDAEAGKSDFQIKGRLDNILNYALSDELLTGNFEFNSNKIDLDELMLSSENQTDTVETAPVEEVADNQSASSEEVARIPQNIKFTLKSNIKKILYDGMEIPDAKTIITLADAKASINLLTVRLFGGKVTLKGSYDTKPVNPFIDFDFDLSKIGIQQIYRQFMTIKRLVPIAEYCKGNISGKMSLSTSLQADMTPIFNTLNSEGAIKSNSIGLVQSPIFKKISDRTKIKELANPTLKNINLKYKIINGELKLQPTDFKIKDAEINLSGTQNLNKNIDFDFKLKTPTKYLKNILNKISNVNKNTQNIITNVKVGNTLDDPKIMKISNNVVDNVKDGVLKEVENVKEDVKAKADKIISDAKKQADKIIAEAENKANALRAEAKKAGEKLIAEAEKQGDALIAKANNPLKKMGATEAKKELMRKAKQGANKLNQEAEAKANKITSTAKKQADKINKKAQDKVNELYSKSKI